MWSFIPALVAISGLGLGLATRGMEFLSAPDTLIAGEGGTSHGCSNMTGTSEPWSKIEPTKELIWHPCYDPTFQCARLQVPLDYSDLEGRQAAIALVRKPALIPADSHLYRGPVLFNPGGPGGSGVNLVLATAHSLSTILGPQYDIVGFDPRGIGRSTPQANFFDTDVERILVAANAGPLPVVKNGTVSGLETSWALAQLVASLAEAHDDGYLKHINTENTATDMLTITRAHGRNKVQYWGFSYGTILGATFAAMYPDNIERFVLDGVGDLEDYYATEWTSNLANTDDVMNFFYDSCAEAGPAKCPFHSAVAEDIRRNLTALYDRVRREPIPVKTDSFYGVVTYSVLRRAIFAALYTPYQAFQPLAYALAQLAAGDGTALLRVLNPSIYKCSCDGHTNNMATVVDGQTTLICNDGDEVPKSLSKLEEYWVKLAEVSEWADVWGMYHTGCVGWPKTKKPFRGPFVANTSYPILVIGNTLDPVTPLRAAKKLAKGFEGSVVLTVDGAGHCSSSVPSVCTQRYIQQYFQDGSLPEPGTICRPAWRNPFIPAPSRGAPHDKASGGVEAEDVEFWNAVMDLSSKSNVFLPPQLQRL